ncbi:NUDIX domain-containing protein [Anaerocolumna sp. AGMB13025]|uniref:NUDIX hydrolase n=1 Tax=Anaerocolumna sp. AGMB13025 TaxID=3039116 RepID=UPI00241C531F|nr:NUDIX domain-containing protein [Anaerocolumna sp. AGMB13025]WFR55020.1 NUDIX domain-containing protein [Anaerocolumna sp. AGMB13025]
MLKVNFYEEIEDKLLKFAVIVSRYQDKWVFCKHKDRTTYEVPGGHREEGEDIRETAVRELVEETGAVSYELHKVCVYSVDREEEADYEVKESYGMLFYAEIKEFGKLPDMEMEYIDFFEDIPKNLTYPLIQPALVERISKFRQNIK